MIPFLLFYSMFGFQRVGDLVWAAGDMRAKGFLLGEGTLAVEMAATARDLAETIHPHPTLSEILMECAEVFYGMATHFARAKKS